MATRPFSQPGINIILGACAALLVSSRAGCSSIDRTDALRDARLPADLEPGIAEFNVVQLLGVTHPIEATPTDRITVQ